MAASLPTHSCGTEIPYAATLCSYCGLPVGIPNVRAADAVDERNALDVRVAQAKISAAATGSEAALDRFHAAASESEAVIAMHLTPLLSLVEAPGTMISTFYGMVDAGIRLPNADHDVNRGILDQAINPLEVHKEIRFAALSLNREGLRWFGTTFITIANSAIAGRATVFEENPLLFFDNKALQPGKPISAGYRAVWDKRADLAVAKLHYKVTSVTKDEEFPGIIMEQGVSSDRADYIEVHIYGPIMRKAIENVTAVRMSKVDMPLWKRIKGKLAAIGVSVKEL